MTLSLRSTSYIAALFVAIILGVLLLLGSRQYRSQQNFAKIIDQNEKIIFQFATIREHISESLLEQRYHQLKEITDEVENLNANISQILQEPLIPDEYKLSFMGQVDLAGVILLLRSIGSGDIELTKIRQLNQEIRIVGDRLMLFDRVVVNHVKRKLVAFQSTIIGILAIVLFIVIYILLFWHRQIAVPLFDLIKQTKEVVLGKRTDVSSRRKGGEVAELVGSFHHLIKTQNKTAEELSRTNLILSIIRRVGDVVRDAESRDVIFAEMCKILLSIDDYCLVWIGVSDKEKSLLPVVADGSTTMSRNECEECMSVLHGAAEERGLEYDAARQASNSKKPVVIHDALSDIPKGHLKNTPMAAGYANCAAFPLAYDHKTYGVMTIYSILPHSFAEPEVELVTRMTSECAFTLYDLENKLAAREMSILQATREKAFETSSDLIFVLNKNNAILEINPRVLHVLDCKQEAVIGRNIFQVLCQDSEPPQPLVNAIQNGTTELDINLDALGGEYHVNIFSLPGHDKKIESRVLIAKDITEEKSNRTETIKTSKLAAMGELSMGVAHEINNLCNGLINYTQILTDEIAEADGDNVHKIGLLNNVIKDGERIAHIVQQLLFFNANRSHLIETVQIEKVMEESLSLIKHQLKHDGIFAKTDFPQDLPPVRINVQKIQHVFLNLLSNARYALNQRYSGHHSNKRLEIKGETLSQAEKQWLRVYFTDWGIGIQPDVFNKLFDPFFSTKPAGEGTGLGLSICYSLVQDNNGDIQIESVPNDHTTITIDLPLA